MIVVYADDRSSRKSQEYWLAKADEFRAEAKMLDRISSWAIRNIGDEAYLSTLELLRYRRDVSLRNIQAAEYLASGAEPDPDGQNMNTHEGMYATLLHFDADDLKKKDRRARSNSARQRAPQARRAIPQSIRRTPRNRAHRATASRPQQAAAGTSPPGSSEGPSGDPDPPLAEQNTTGQTARGARNVA